jgi:hypothetical protein
MIFQPDVPVPEAPDPGPVSEAQTDAQPGAEPDANTESFHFIDLCIQCAIIAYFTLLIYHHWETTACHNIELAFLKTSASVRTSELWAERSEVWREQAEFWTTVDTSKLWAQEADFWAKKADFWRREGEFWGFEAGMHKAHLAVCQVELDRYLGKKWLHAHYLRWLQVLGVFIGSSLLS